jgi:hypothetical protein
MSSSYRSRLRQWGGSGFVLAAALALPGRALAADGYFVPEFELTGLSRSNPELVPTNSSSASGVRGSVGGVFGWRSPRAFIEARPKIDYEDYSSRPELENFNQYLYLNGRYETRSGDWAFFANYSRENSYTAQRAAAGYDELDPNNPIVDETGRIVVLAETYTRAQLRPSFTHNFSQRFGMEINALYQNVDVSSQLAASDARDYDDTRGEALFYWNWRPLSRIGAGVYAERFKSKDGLDATDSRGLSLQFYQNWTQTFSGGVELNLERSDVDEVGTALDSTSNNVSVNFSLQKRGQISTLRMDGGRIYSPSTGGARVSLDQLRVQYSRQFKPLWSYLVAARGFRSREQGAQLVRSDRDYAAARLQLTRELTRTWYVSGNYNYTWQKYVGEPSGANDSYISLGFGYRGLDPQR